MEKNRRLTEDFNKLFIELENEGCFEPSYFQAFLRLAELFVFAGIGIVLYFGNSNACYKIVGFVLMSLARSRAAFLTHELGHYSFTGNTKVDTLIDIFVHGKYIKLQNKQKFHQFVTLSLGVFLGISTTWWKRQHNRHHAMPQRMHRDVDIETLPLLAYNTAVAKRSKHKNGFFIRNQVCASESDFRQI